MKALKIVLVLVVVLVIVATIAARLAPRLLEAMLIARNRDIKSAASLTSLANKIKDKAGLPKMIDEETEAFDVKGQEGVLVYSYRLVKVNATEFDAQQFVVRMKPVTTGLACSQDDRGLFMLKQGIVLRYSFVDKFDVPIGSFDVNQGDCDPGRDVSPTDRVRWKPEGTQNAQPEQQPEAKPDSPWKSETPSETPAAKPPHQTVETPEAKAQALVEDGNWQVDHKNYDAAIKDFQAALALDPSNYAARSGLQEAQHMR
jgi:hypothetical protein